MRSNLTYCQTLLTTRWRHFALATDRAIWASRVFLEKVPISPGLRLRARRTIFVPWTRAILVDRLLLGAQHNLTGAQFAERSGDLMWTSTPLRDGPHAELLRSAISREPTSLTDDDILQSSYAALARRCIRVSGDFFGAQDEQDTCHRSRIC